MKIKNFDKIHLRKVMLVLQALATYTLRLRVAANSLNLSSVLCRHWTAKVGRFLERLINKEFGQREIKDHTFKDQCPCAIEA